MARLQHEAAHASLLELKPCVEIAKTSCISPGNGQSSRLLNLLSKEQQKSGYKEQSSSMTAAVTSYEGQMSGPDPADSIDIASQRIEHLGSLDKDIQFASNMENSDQTESRLLPSLLPNSSDRTTVHPSPTAAPATGAPSADALLYSSLCRMDDLAAALQASSGLHRFYFHVIIYC